jgi:hypothetical protein
LLQNSGANGFQECNRIPTAGSGCRFPVSRAILKHSAMRRSAALVLLVCFVAAGFTPVLQALSGFQPHACCLRRLHSGSNHGCEISSPPPRGGNCCPPLRTPHSTVLTPATVASIRPFEDGAADLGYSRSFSSSHIVGFSNRAPPPQAS